MLKNPLDYFPRCVGSRYGMQKIAEKLKEHNISGLLIIGGFEVSLIPYALQFKCTVIEYQR